MCLMITKRCSVCQEEKLLTDFYKENASKMAGKQSAKYVIARQPTAIEKEIYPYIQKQAKNIGINYPTAKTT